MEQTFYVWHVNVVHMYYLQNRCAKRATSSSAASDSPDSPSGENKKRIHRCFFPDCRKVYTKSSHLKAHQRTHTGMF